MFMQFVSRSTTFLLIHLFTKTSLESGVVWRAAGPECPSRRMMALLEAGSHTRHENGPGAVNWIEKIYITALVSNVCPAKSGWKS